MADLVRFGEDKVYVSLGSDGNDYLDGGEGNHTIQVLNNEAENDIILDGLGIDMIKDFNRSEGDKIQIINKKVKL